jgi:PII-like signaling protein
MVVELVDEVGKIESFRPILAQMMEESGSGGMVTLGDIEVIHYEPEKG